MPASHIAPEEARSLAAVVPALLNLHVTTARPSDTDSVDAYVDRLADAVLHWHDALIGGPVAQVVEDAGRFHVPHLLSGGPGTTDLASLRASAALLRRCASRITRVQAVVASPTLADVGVNLSGAARALADVLDEHAEAVRSGDTLSR